MANNPEDHRNELQIAKGIHYKAVDHYNEKDWILLQAANQEMARSTQRIKRLFAAKKLLKQRWEKNNIKEYLRIMVDKNIVGFSCKALERMDTLMTRCFNAEQLKTKGISNAIIKSVRLHVRKEMVKLNHEVLSEMKKMVRSKVGNVDLAPTENRSSGERLSDGQFRLIDRTKHVYEKNGEKFKKIMMMVPYDDFVKFKAAMDLEEGSFQKWLRLRMRKYVSFRFKQIAQIKGLADPIADKLVSDDEMSEGGDSYPIEKTKSQGQEKITPPTIKEDLGGEGS